MFEFFFIKNQPFSSPYCKSVEPGVYKCGRCNVELFLLVYLVLISSFLKLRSFFFKDPIINAQPTAAGLVI